MSGGKGPSRAAQQRRALLAHDDEPPPYAQAAVPPGRPAGRRHCWVVLPEVEPMPGVVAGWRRLDGGGWAARVAYALGDETGGVVTGWLPASVLRPYEATAAATDERAGA